MPDWKGSSLKPATADFRNIGRSAGRSTLRFAVPCTEEENDRDIAQQNPVISIKSALDRSKQGPDAKGGAKNYVVDGKMTRGFAVVAYPAQYGDSGIMTFLINQSGVVYQKDLGKTTKEVAAAMTEFNPDKTWKAVQE